MHIVGQCYVLFVDVTLEPLVLKEDNMLKKFGKKLKVGFGDNNNGDGQMNYYFMVY